LAVQKNNLRRLLRTVEALSDLGPEMTAERDFVQRAATIVTALLQAASAREGSLFTFSDKPALLSSIASEGFALMPEPAIIPLLPKHVHALTIARHPIILDSTSSGVYLSANGNVAPELFKCIAPLTVNGKLVGIVALGRREGNALYESDELDALDLLCNYVALAVQNHSLSQTLAQWVLRQHPRGIRDGHRRKAREYTRPLVARGTLRFRHRRSPGNGGERRCCPSLGGIFARYRKGRCR
jgi:GAF domain-containing protein